jgi:cyclopropane-fatty-acyl-phospholipid synthase
VKYQTHPDALYKTVPAQDRANATPPAVLERILKPTGARFDGDRPWDIQIRNPDTYRRILVAGSLGFGEAYMDGLWDSEQLDELFTRLLRADLDRRIQGLLRLRLLFASLGNYLRHCLLNLQSCSRAFQVGEHHYDIGNDVFQAMLDSRLCYSCGYWPEAEDLETAQFNKLDLVCRKLQLSPGERLLDIGCGWGSLARFAAEHYGVEVTGITISREQMKLAQERCRGLPVEIRLLDYRELEGRFDKVVSIGMFEHVGEKNYRTYFRTVNRVMAPDGLFLLHTIGNYRTQTVTDPWIHKYIFPNGQIPSAQRIAQAIEPNLIFRDWHNFGPDYDRTLMAWWDRFERAWPNLRAGYDERFYRMWKYYLHCCAGYFRSGHGQLWQIVLSRRGTNRDYHSQR